jgi:hypothetical protein
MTVTKSPITEESPKETVKTIAQGMPDRFGLPVVTLLVCFFCFAREAAGVSIARYSLRPLCRGTLFAELGREERGGIGDVRPEPGKLTR